MDNQNKLPDIQDQSAVPRQPQTPTEPKAIPTTTVVNEAGKPKVEMNDAQVEALLMLQSAQNSTQPKHKLPLGLIFTIIVLVIILSMAGPLISRVTSAKKSSSKQTTGSSSQSKSPDQSTTDEVNNDVQQCQNVATALSEC